MEDLDSKKYKIAVSCPTMSSAICDYVYKSIEESLPITITRVGLVEDFFSLLGDPKFNADFIAIDIVALSKVKTANLFDIISTLSTLIKCTVTRTSAGKPTRRETRLIALVDNAAEVTSAYELMVKRQYPESYTELSRLFVYYNTRILEGTLNDDSGVMYIRNALASVKKYGICKEQFWPYRINRFNVRPIPEAYTDAQSRTITEYRSVPNIDIIPTLISEGYPVIIGLNIYEGFGLITKDDPVVYLPKSNEELVGGHAMVLVGYDLKKKLFLAKNSFGPYWGNGGYCWISYNYADRYIFDKWCFDINNPRTTLLTVT